MLKNWLDYWLRYAYGMLKIAHYKQEFFKLLPSIL